MQLTRVVAHAALQLIDRYMLHIDNKQHDVTRDTAPVQRAPGGLAQRYITLSLTRQIHQIASGDMAAG
jgi:hypothetical protein